MNYIFTPVASESPGLERPSAPTSRTPSPIPSEPDAPPSHDAEYYLHDEMAIFLVERRLFKIHRHFFVRESDVFRTMFSCPPGHETMEGMTDDRPISLPGITGFEFKTLLDFFYNGMHDGFKLSLKEWTAILSISSRYDMDKIRRRAIGQIISHRPRIEPVEKFVLAEKHNIPDWLPAAYASLCQRANPLEEWEAEKLGLRITVKLARAREAVRELNSRRGSPIRPQQPWSPVSVQNLHDMADYERYDNRDVSRIVDEVFFPSVGVPNAPQPF